ncbi:hypothetical protein [Nonomuraea sp. B19D2]|uniref:RICIN domain-containing protein n=1 Tax=Nonomuraea sp. B19D2 TaxID=3159561 RepID=UPI0032DAE8BA
MLPLIPGDGKGHSVRRHVMVPGDLSSELLALTICLPAISPPLAPALRVGLVFRIQCADGGRVLGLAGTSQGAQVVLADDNGANNNLWRFL